MNIKREREEVYRLFLLNKSTEFIKKYIDLLRKVYKEDEKQVLSLVRPKLDEEVKYSTCTALQIHNIINPRCDLKTLKSILEDNFKGIRYKNESKHYFVNFINDFKPKAKYFPEDSSTEF